MKSKDFIPAFLAAAMLFQTNFALAETFLGCRAAFAHYESDDHPHKAFATLGGALPSEANKGRLVCGGGWGLSRSVAIHQALKFCRITAKKYRAAEPCKIVESK